jgi:hypothetical protein
LYNLRLVGADPRFFSLIQGFKKHREPVGLGSGMLRKRAERVSHADFTAQPYRFERQVVFEKQVKFWAGGE